MDDILFTLSRRSSTPSSSFQLHTGRILQALDRSSLSGGERMDALTSLFTLQQTVIIARFIGGLAASTGSTLVGGTVADLFETHNRGLPMSIFSICAFMGTGLGPAVSGYIELKKGWRWIEWVQVSKLAATLPPRSTRGSHYPLQMMFAGVMAVLIIFFTRETRGSVILSRRARKMRKETGDPRYQCRSDAERASLAVLIRVSMTRPLCT